MKFGPTVYSIQPNANPKTIPSNSQPLPGPSAWGVSTPTAPTSHTWAARARGHRPEARVGETEGGGPAAGHPHPDPLSLDASPPDSPVSAIMGRVHQPVVSDSQRPSRVPAVSP